MRRSLVFVLASLGLALVAWFASRSPSTPSAAVQPQGPDRSTEGVAERPARVDAIEGRVAAHPSPQAVANDDSAFPANAPIARPDPTEAELASFARLVPPGTIEGIVLRGLTPVEGGMVWLGSMATGGLPWGSSTDWDADPSVLRAPIGQDGVFRFTGLSPDTYGVGVRAPDGATRHVYFDLPAEVETQRIRIVLGTGTVRGHVYDERGVACAGWKVGLYNFGNVLAGVQVIAGQDSDAAGAFEFDGLVGGTYGLSAGPVVDRRDPRTRTLSFELAAGETKTVDLGSSSAARWTGRVLLPRGAALQLVAHAELRFEAGEVRESAVLSPEGGFEVQLAAGTYRVSLLAFSTASGTLVDLGEIAMPASGLDRDIVLPGAVLRVRPTYQGTQEPEVVRQSLRTWLERSDSRRSSLCGADRNEYFLGLEPGEYLLSASPSILGAPTGKIPVLIRESDDEVELDIVVGDA